MIASTPGARSACVVSMPEIRPRGIVEVTSAA